MYLRVRHREKHTDTLFVPDSIEPGQLLDLMEALMDYTGCYAIDVGRDKTVQQAAKEGWV